MPTRRPPPPLPRMLADPRPVMAAGTAVWAVVLAAFLIRAAAGHTDSAVIVTAAVGTALGAVGYGIFFWQRRAVRHGGRGGQRGLS